MYWVGGIAIAGGAFAAKELVVASSSMTETSVDHLGAAPSPPSSSSSLSFPKSIKLSSPMDVNLLDLFSLLALALLPLPYDPSFSSEEDP